MLLICRNFNTRNNTAIITYGGRKSTETSFFRYAFKAQLCVIAHCLTNCSYPIPSVHPIPCPPPLCILYSAPLCASYTLHPSSAHEFFQSGPKQVVLCTYGLVQHVWNRLKKKDGWTPGHPQWHSQHPSIYRRGGGGFLQSTWVLAGNDTTLEYLM